MSNISKEDIDQVLEDLELPHELIFANKPALGRGGFGSVHQARSVVCLGRSPEGLHSHSHLSHLFSPRYDGDHCVVKKVSTTNMTDAERRVKRRKFILEAATMKELR